MSHVGNLMGIVVAISLLGVAIMNGEIMANPALGIMDRRYSLNQVMMTAFPVMDRNLAMPNLTLIGGPPETSIKVSLQAL